MFPSPIGDVALLREHLYQENIFTNLYFVLNPLKFSSIGGFKSIKDCGLGYFNYEIKPSDNIYIVSVWSRIGYSVFTKFEILLYLYLVFLVYCAMIVVKIDNTPVLDHLLYFLKHKKKFMNKATRLLDLQEKGEYSSGKHENKDHVTVSGATDSTKSVFKETEINASGVVEGTVHSRTGADNSEYSHVKL